MRRTEKLTETREIPQRPPLVGPSAQPVLGFPLHAGAGAQSISRSEKKRDRKIERILTRVGAAPLALPSAPPLSHVETVILRAVRNLTEKNPDGPTFAAVAKVVCRAMKRTHMAPNSFDTEVFARVVDGLTDPGRHLLTLGPGDVRDDRRLSLLPVGKLIAIVLPRSVGSDLKPDVAEDVNEMAEGAPRVVAMVAAKKKIEAKKKKPRP